MSSFGLEPKSIISSVSAAGAISAEPAPWTARPASSTATSIGEAGGERAGGQDGPAGGEDPAGAEQVGQPAAEQQQAAEGDDVGVEDPATAVGGEAEVGLDLGQRDADDRGVHDDHELGERDERERRPAPRVCGLHEGVPFSGRGCDLIR